MDPMLLLQLLRERPFVPFRLYLSDRTMIEVPHPERLVVGTETAHVFLPDPNHPQLYRTWKIVSLQHIARLETLESPAPSDDPHVVSR